MDIVFCADRRVLPGLHVAAWSILRRAGDKCLPLHFHIFSDELDQNDQTLLEETLSSTGKDFRLTLESIDPSHFLGFPTLNGGWAAYYRLYAADVVKAERFFYVDVDTLCDMDLSVLLDVEFSGRPVAWVPEAPLSSAVDRIVAEELGNDPDQYYFNSGVMLINRGEWIEQRITERSMQYLQNISAKFHDQSALNVVLHENAVVLPEQFNLIANMRKHWPVLKKGFGLTDSLIHFVDYPKPWSFLAEWVCPYHSIWNEALKETRFEGFHSWAKNPARRLPSSAKDAKNYKKAIKDKLLFTGYRSGWLKSVKGVNG